MSVCLSVCPFVCSRLRYHLFAPTSRSGMSNIFRDLESLGKSNGKKWSQIWIFKFESGLKLPNKKLYILADFALQTKVETTLPDGLETCGWRAYHLFWHISRHFWIFALWMIFFLPFFKQFWFLGILCPPRNHASWWIRGLWSKGISPILAYF